MPRARRSLPAASLLFLASASPASTLDAQSPEPSFYLDRSHVTLEYASRQKILTRPSWYDTIFQARDDELLVEARAALNLFIVNRLTSRTLTEGGRAWVLAFTPVLQGRILRGFSQPLRTPSFFLKATAQYHWAQKLGSGPDPAERPTLLMTTQGVWGHHSNGAAGCLFNQQSVDNDDCVTTGNPDPTTLTVDPDGSFSTNYLSASFSVARLRFHRADRDDAEGHIHEYIYGRLEYEVHPENLRYLFFYSGGAEGPFRQLYGAHRLELEAEYETEADLLGLDMRLSARGSWKRIFHHVKPTPDASANAWTAELSYRLDGGFGRGWGPLIRYYRGQDYYNLFFIRDVQRLQFGIVIDRSWRGIS